MSSSPFPYLATAKPAVQSGVSGFLFTTPLFFSTDLLLFLSVLYSIIFITIVIIISTTQSVISTQSSSSAFFQRVTLPLFLLLFVSLLLLWWSDVPKVSCCLQGPPGARSLLANIIICDFLCVTVVESLLGWGGAAPPLYFLTLLLPPDKYNQLKKERKTEQTKERIK